MKNYSIVELVFIALVTIGILLVYVLIWTFSLEILKLVLTDALTIFLIWYLAD